MHIKLHIRALAILATVEIALALTISKPLYASDLNCQYQGRPDSVERSQPGFGIIFGGFRLVNSPSACPNDIQGIQFSGSSASNSAIFVGAIETCLNMATLLVVDRGFIMIDLDDPLTGEPGIVIGNHQTAVVNSCRISLRRAE
jgi:hypothetical protein